MLMMGQTSEDDLRAAFLEQAQALARAGVDGLVIETMSDPAEAVLAVAAAKETGLPVVACMTFDSGAKLDRTMMGTTPEQAAAQLLAAGADSVGSNCGHGIEGMLEICRRLHAASGRPVWIKANAGLPKMHEGKAIYAQTAEEFAGHVPALIAAGAGMIGGCCGTTPEFVIAVRRQLDSRATDDRGERGITQRREGAKGGGKSKEIGTDIETPAVVCVFVALLLLSVLLRACVRPVAAVVSLRDGSSRAVCRNLRLLFRLHPLISPEGGN